MSEDDRSGPSARQTQGEYPRKDFFHTDYVPTPPHVANPSPLGLGAFGVTAFVLSCFNANFTVAGGSPPSIEIGLAIFYGGICQILAGQWEFKAGHTFEATVFTSYGGFWLSFGVIMVLDLKSDSYGNNLVRGDAANHELGIFLLAWTIFSVICFLCVLRVNLATILLFALLIITLLLLTISQYQHGNTKATTTKAAGYTGIILALNSLYIALAGLATKENTYFTLPVGPIAALEKRWSNFGTREKLPSVDFD